MFRSVAFPVERLRKFTESSKRARNRHLTGVSSEVSKKKPHKPQRICKERHRERRSNFHNHTQLIEFVNIKRKKIPSGVLKTPAASNPLGKRRHVC